MVDTPTLYPDTQTDITYDATTGSYTLSPGVYQVSYGAGTAVAAGETVTLGINVNGVVDDSTTVTADENTASVERTVNYVIDSPTLISLSVVESDTTSQSLSNANFNITKLA